jgi:hypothetical protein
MVASNRGGQALFCADLLPAKVGTSVALSPELKIRTHQVSSGLALMSRQSRLLARPSPVLTRDLRGIPQRHARDMP